MLNMTKYEIVVFTKTQKVAFLECEMEGSTLPAGDACGRCFGMQICWQPTTVENFLNGFLEVLTHFNVTLIHFGTLLETCAMAVL